MYTIAKENSYNNTNLKVYPCTPRRLAFAAMCLSLCMLLPFVAMQIPQLGSMLSPMHIPVLLAGYLCGGWFAMIVGLIAPILRFVMFGMPQIIPTGLCMSIELATYGLFSGILFRRMPNKPWGVYVSLVLAMLGGRLIWGFAAKLIYAASGMNFTWELFLAGAFVNAIPAIILHILLIPPIVIALIKAKLIWMP